MAAVLIEISQFFDSCAKMALMEFPEQIFLFVSLVSTACCRLMAAAAGLIFFLASTGDIFQGIDRVKLKRFIRTKEKFSAKIFILSLKKSYKTLIFK